MNIEEAKSEIRKALNIYLLKDENGKYEIPPERQRPILVIGAPGIGKTAIMQQLASEMDLGLVNYTITHHTRQSAIGLPYISKRVYDGVETSVTEYTMSEIITMVYDSIEIQGHKEGILFIDEVNCVSETLAPAMLDLLQNKKFGPHRIPQGWILVTAGNPAEYNRSVREFDVVTLDRVKLLNVEPDFDTWQKYAYSKRLHQAVIYYLNLKKQNLFKTERTVLGYNYVTPRGWEDLAVAMQKYEKTGYEVNATLIEQYISDKRIASEFYNYYLLFGKYTDDYDVKRILEGNSNDVSERLADAKFDEKLGVVSVFSGTLNNECEEFYVKNEVLDKLKGYRETEKQEKSEADIVALMEKASEDYDLSISNEEKRILTALISELKAILQKGGGLKKHVAEMTAYLKDEQIKIRKHVEKLFSFLDRTFGKGQEMISFVINLLASRYFVRYITYCDCPVFFDYNELLLVDKQNKILLEEIAKYKSSIKK